MSKSTRKLALAWWFAYSITNAAGEPITGQIVPNLADEVTCNRVLHGSQMFWGSLLAGLTGWGAHFTKCEPDRPDKMPR